MTLEILESARNDLADGASSRTFGRAREEVKYVIIPPVVKESRASFIDRHRALFWYTPEAAKRDVSDDLLVETILNFGTLDDYRELRDLMTPRRMAKVFFSATGRKAGNYYPEIRNFFSLVLKQYA